MDYSVKNSSTFLQQFMPKIPSLSSVGAANTAIAEVPLSGATKSTQSQEMRLKALMKERGWTTNQELINYFMSEGRGWNQASAMASTFGLNFNKMIKNRKGTPIAADVKQRVAKKQKTVSDKKKDKSVKEGNGRFLPNVAKYELYVNAVKSMGYSLNEEVDNVNIIGIRGWLKGKSVPNVFNRYNDTIVCVWQHRVGDKIYKFCEEFKASVDPGDNSSTPRSRRHPDGLGHLMNGQYQYKMDWHRPKSGAYEALRIVDNRDLRVWRTSYAAKKDEDHTYNSSRKETTGQNFNIHAAGGGDNVNTWSAGCQVIAAEKGKTGGASNAMFKKFRDDILKQFDSDQKFTYTLIDGTDIDKYQEAQKQQSHDGSNCPVELRRDLWSCFFLGRR